MIQNVYNSVGRFSADISSCFATDSLSEYKTSMLAFMQCIYQRSKTRNTNTLFFHEALTFHNKFKKKKEKKKNCEILELSGEELEVLFHFFNHYSFMLFPLMHTVSTMYSFINIHRHCRYNILQEKLQISRHIEM